MSHAEGKEPRLVLDSAVCAVNPKCNIPERVSLPMASNVRLAFMPADTHASFIGASFDFKAAHKQIQVHPSENGCSCFSSRTLCTITEYATAEPGSPRTGGSAQEHSCSGCCTPAQSLVVCRRPFGRIAPPRRASTTCVDCHIFRSHQCAHFLEESAVPELPDLVRMVH